MKKINFVFLGLFIMILASCTSTADKQMCEKTCLDYNHSFETKNDHFCGCKQKENEKDRIFKM